MRFDPHMAARCSPPNAAPVRRLRRLHPAVIALAAWIATGAVTTQARAESLPILERIIASIFPDPRCVPPPKFEYTSGSIDKLALDAKLLSVVRAAGVKLEDGRTVKSVIEGYNGNAGELVAAIGVYYTQCLIIVSSQMSAEKKLELLSTSFKKSVVDREQRTSRHSPLDVSARLLATVQTGTDAVGDLQATLDAVGQSLPAKLQWQRQWFRRAPGGEPLTGPSCYHVIVASPPGGKAADVALAKYNLHYPGVYFELWEKEGNKYLAVTAGIGLSLGPAQELKATLARMGMKDAYLWRWPGPGPACA